jgi:hypothetical protein
VAGFKRALALDPSLGQARSGLSKAEWLQSRRKWTRGGIGLVVAFALAFGLWLLWRRTGAPKQEATTT